MVQFEVSEWLPSAVVKLFHLLLPPPPRPTSLPFPGPLVTLGSVHIQIVVCTVLWWGSTVHDNSHFFVSHYNIHVFVYSCLAWPFCVYFLFLFSFNHVKRSSVLKLPPFCDCLWCFIYTFIYFTLINCKSSLVISLYEILTSEGL